MNKLCLAGAMRWQDGSVDSAAASRLNLLIDIKNSDQNMNDNYTQRLVKDVADDVFNKDRGEFVESSSECSSQSRSSESSVDKRLQYWKDMLKERRALQQKLRLATGRQPQDMLFNRLTSIDHRNKQTIKRVLDHAERIKPAEKKWPQAQVEIVGMPHKTAVELLGPRQERGKTKSKWLNSPALTQHIIKQFPNIERVLEFYPDIHKLQVVGYNAKREKTGEWHSLSDISNISEPPVKSKLSINKLSQRHSKHEQIEEHDMMINGSSYKRIYYEYAPIIHRLFSCNPYERNLRIVLHIENNGCHVINFSWRRVDNFAYNKTLFEPLDEEFVFDTESFLLKPGENREVQMLFQPRKVCIVKQSWVLATNPALFPRRPCALTLRLHGHCTPPPEYLELLDNMMELSKELPVEPVVNPVEEAFCKFCPYQRPLDEREIFNLANRGYHCDRYEDLELLKEFFGRVSKYRNEDWNFSVNRLVRLICRKSPAEQRWALFEELQKLLSLMRGRADYLSGYELSETQAKLAERQLTCRIYVRGIISNGIEVWEEQIWSLESQLLKAALQRYYECNVIGEDENVLTFDELFSVMNKSSSMMASATFSFEGIVAKVKGQISHSKYFRDAIYMHTYTQLCDIAEDIVSVIESTELV